MKKVTLHLPRLHLVLTRLTMLVAWALAGLSLALVASLALYSLTQWYNPLRATEIPEEKLTQNRDQLRVKDLEAVRAQLELKQKPTGPFTENPFP